MEKFRKNIKCDPFTKLCLSGVLSFIATFAIYRTMFSYDVASGENVVWMVIFGLGLFVIYKSLSVEDKRLRTTAIVTAMIFAFFYVIGYSISTTSHITQYVYSLKGIVKFVIYFSGFTFLFYALLALLFQFVLHTDFRTKGREISWFTNNKRSFLLVWLVIFLCWLPYFLFFYPGLMSPDTVMVMSQALGNEALTAHHTIFHIALVSLFLHIGQALGSLTLGAALFTLFQMLTLAGMLSFSIRYLAYRNVNKGLRFCILLYFALFPVNGFYSVTIWKDILFGGTTLVLFLLMIETVHRPQRMLKTASGLCSLCLFIVLFCLGRNNGKYAFLLFVPFAVYYLRRYWKNMIPVAVGCCFLIGSFNFIAFSVIGAKKPSVRESLSVPLQQIARVVKEHGTEISDQDKAIIDEILPYDQLPELYREQISDNVKEKLDEEALKADLGRYAALWFRLFWQHPKTYLESFLCGTYGYWYPNVQYWINTYVPPSTVNDLKINHANLMPISDDIIIQLNENTLRVLPVFSMLYSIGFMIWVVILSAAIFILKGEKKMLIPLALLAALWLTVLASPVFAEYRYIYGVILCAPVSIALAATAGHNHMEIICMKNKKRGREKELE